MITVHIHCESQCSTVVQNLCHLPCLQSAHHLHYCLQTDFLVLLTQETSQMVSVFILLSILQWIEILTSLCDVCISPDEALVSRDAYTHLAACYDYILRYLTPLQFNELSHCILRYNVVKYKTTS